MATASKVLKMPKGGVISQVALANYIDKLNQIKALKKETDKTETEFFVALKAGATVQRGVYGAKIAKVPGKRSPKWKEIFIEHVDPKGTGRGTKLAEEILNETPAGESKEEVEIYEVQNA